VLTLLHFARRTADTALLDRALAAAEDLGARQDALGGELRSGTPRRPVGLLTGGAGQALAFLRLYEHTRQGWLLDRAEQALRRDLSHCTTTAEGTLHVEDGPRVLPYLETGSAGIGLVLHDYLRHRPDPLLSGNQQAISRAAEATFVVQPNLFNGRAGLISYLTRVRQESAGAQESQAAQESQTARIDTVIDRHRRLLCWHMIPCQGHLGFPGEQLLRLSTDLGTGSAGVLLALGTALAGTPGLPFTEPLPDPGT
jgi:hypothetical protein